MQGGPSGPSRGNRRRHWDIPGAGVALQRRAGGTACHCEGDTEPTKAIHFTREFEGVADHQAQLVYRFIRPGDRVLAAKPSKEVVPARRRGEALRAARRHAQVYNALAFAWALDHEQHQDDETVAGAAPAAKPDGK